MNTKHFITLIFITVLVWNSKSFSQEKKIEGIWLVCVSESECDDSKSGVYFKFENNTMSSFVKSSGVEFPYGDKYNYSWENGELVVTKEGDPQEDRYLIKIDGDKMVMTHKLNKSANHFQKRPQ